MVSVFQCLLRLALCPIIQSILGQVLLPSEKNVCSVEFGLSEDICYFHLICDVFFCFRCHLSVSLFVVAGGLVSW